MIRDKLYIAIFLILVSGMFYLVVMVRKQCPMVSTDLEEDEQLETGEPGSGLSVEEMQRLVEKANTVRPRGAGGAVLAVLAGRDRRALRRLLRSLAAVHGVNRSLLVVSHRYHHEHINRLVSSVRFCKTMQIFYPFSLQLHPDEFPGVDPGDCIANAAFGDPVVCQPRDARTTEHKQHWWWTATFIFERMIRYDGHVVFLQEDDVVLPDMLHMLKYMRHAAGAYLTTAHVLSLGQRDAGAAAAEFDKLVLQPWRPAHDRGLAFNRTTWRRVAFLSSFFCMYNDSSWSYSLLNLLSQFPGGHVDMVASESPRVLAGAAAAARGAGAARLFPGQVRVVVPADWHGRAKSASSPALAPNGGFGDLRDQLLCMDPLLGLTTVRDDYTTIFPEFVKISTFFNNESII